MAIETNQTHHMNLAKLQVLAGGVSSPFSAMLVLLFTKIDLT